MHLAARERDGEGFIFRKIRVKEAHGDRKRTLIIEETDADVGRPKVLREGSRDHIIRDVRLGAAEKINIPDDPGHAELVLVLEVGAVAPFEGQHREEIFALAQEIRHVKLGGVVGHLAVTDVSSVQPDKKAGVDALENEMRARRLRVGMPGEGVPIGPAGILLRHIGRVKREGIADVRVLVGVVAAHLPGEGHGFGPPGRVRGIVLPVEFVGERVDTRKIPEIPVRTAQKLNPVGVFPRRRSGLPGLARCRDEISVVRQRVFVQDRQIFIEPFYQQGHDLLSLSETAVTHLLSYRGESSKHMHGKVYFLHRRARVVAER